MSNDGLAKVREIFEELFDAAQYSISLETKASDISEWDSVGHLSLCGALEEAFDLQFSVNELAEMTSVRTIICIIEAKKKRRSASEASSHFASSHHSSTNGVSSLPGR